MKASELMIGNWVYAIDGNGEKHPCRVNDLKYDYINDREDFCVDFYGTGYNPKWPDVAFNVEPIFITSEILQKNGWIKASGYWVLKGYSTRLGWKDGEMIVGYSALPEKILYVHELQNLMKAVKISCNFEI